MIEFLTLLLGLVVGPQTIELAVEGPVARVEVLLDGRRVAELSGEPWSTRVDFGEALVPRLLEAVAHDARGNAISRARQIVNYARSNHEAVLVLEQADAGGHRSGRVAWQAILDRRPKRIELTLDDRPIEVSKSGDFQLPPLDTEKVHSLTAIVHFAGKHRAQADLVFGGLFGDRVSSALTAVPLLVPDGATPPNRETLNRRLIEGSRSLSIFSVSQPTARVMVVRDPDLEARLAQLDPELESLGEAFRLPIVEPGDTVAFVPVATLPRHPGHFRASRIRQEKMRRGLWNLLSRSYPRQPVRGRRELWAAVAAAGLGAVDNDDRRAVVVLLAPGAPTVSGVSASQAIGYLRSIRAPHFVWAPSESDLPTVDPALNASLYSGAEGMYRLLQEVDTSLRSQHVVWLEGLHFPARVQLIPGADGLLLAR
jgi:hypothetical protein